MNNGKFEDFLQLMKKKLEAFEALIGEGEDVSFIDPAMTENFVHNYCKLMKAYEKELKDSREEGSDQSPDEKIMNINIDVICEIYRFYKILKEPLRSQPSLDKDNIYVIKFIDKLEKYNLDSIKGE